LDNSENGGLSCNGNIKPLLRRGRGYRHMNYLLLKAQLLADTKTEFVAFPESRVECVLLQIIVQNCSF
jgi:hypothetical protein